MADHTKCRGITCEVRNTCKRFTSAASYAGSWTAFYATDSFRPATGCEYYWPMPGIQGRIVADFDKARERG